MASDDLEPSSRTFKVSIPGHIRRIEPCIKVFKDSYLTKISFSTYWPTFTTHGDMQDLTDRWIDTQANHNMPTVHHALRHNKTEKDPLPLNEIKLQLE